MKFEESFTVAEPPERVWEFFEDLDRVAWCVPGVESVTHDDGERLRVALTQRVGAVKATFDMKMQVSERDPLHLLELTATGRSVRGAAGQLRARNRVEFEPEDGGTRVRLIADVTVAGTIATVGQKVMASRAREAAREFAGTLDTRMRSWARGEEVPSAEAPPAPAPAAAPTPAWRRPAVLAGAAAVAILVAVTVVLLMRRRR